MARRRSRRLDADEEALWQRVARTARPMKSAPARKTPLTQKPKPGPSEPLPTPHVEIEPFEIGSRAATAVPSAPAEKAPHLRMDRSTYQKMKRGKTRPEARIDLHGMTADAALSALSGFLFRAHASGKRLVLVITGKGRDRDDGGPIPVRTGILRRQVPEWLTRPPLSAVVLEVTEAHQRHGGAGALYVYLRRA